MRSHRTTTKVLACAGAALAAVALPASAASAATGRATVPARSAGPPAHHRVLVDCVERPQVRPHDFVLACGDGNNALTSLHWSHWGRYSATATGVDVVNDCVPYCAAGHFHGYPVTVRLDRARPWKDHPGRWQYTRLEMTYHGARPAFSQAREVFPLWD